MKLQSEKNFVSEIAKVKKKKEKIQYEISRLRPRRVGFTPAPTRWARKIMFVLTPGFVNV